MSALRAEDFDYVVIVDRKNLTVRRATASEERAYRETHPPRPPGWLYRHYRQLRNEGSNQA